MENIKRVRMYNGLKSIEEKVCEGDLVCYRVRESKSIYRRTVLYVVTKQHSPATYSIVNIRGGKELQVHVNDMCLADYQVC
jgi:hypothetical protein